MVVPTCTLVTPVPATIGSAVVPSAAVAETVRVPLALATTLVRFEPRVVVKDKMPPAPPAVTIGVILSSRPMSSSLLVCILLFAT